ncbi:hypothetical protein A616_16965 [Brevibacillus brevis X23]|nr:hypothetical protein A616_16965 [Brevibacillus brevis X23]
MNGINKKLSRSIEMIEVATKKMHEKKTGKRAEVSAKATACGVIKIRVAAYNIDTEDQESALMAAQYMLNDMYISKVLLQNNVPERAIRVDSFTLEWMEAYEESDTYTVIGMLVINAEVNLFKSIKSWTWANVESKDEVLFQTTSGDYISLDCLGCAVSWNEARVA